MSCISRGCGFGATVTESGKVGLAHFVLEVCQSVACLDVSWRLGEVTGEVIRTKTMQTAICQNT